MNTTLQPTTPRMGDMIDASGMTEEQCDMITQSFGKYMPEYSAFTAFYPSDDHGSWYCWCENNTVELGQHGEHFSHLENQDMRVLTFDFERGVFLECFELSTTSSNRTAYADNINYYKRMIQQGTYPQNKLTRDQALQKLGYWEGRYDELTAGGRGE